MRKVPPFALAALLALASPAWAQSVKATVTKVDEAAGKVTLDHERIPKLGANTAGFGEEERKRCRSHVQITGRGCIHTEA